MINPVPVNLVHSKIRESSPTFGDKRPASILKQSSNILTRSISGISAISFEEWENYIPTIIKMNKTWIKKKKIENIILVWEIKLLSIKFTIKRCKKGLEYLWLQKYYRV